MHTPQFLLSLLLSMGTLGSWTPSAALQLSAPTALGTRTATQPKRLWTVSPAAGEADFTSIQEAIDVAGSGDAILLLDDGADSYDGFTIAGKGLAIFAEAISTTVSGPVVVRDVPASEAVVLRGFDVFLQLSAGAAASGPMLDVRDCAGPVWIEDVAVNYDTDGVPIVIADCASVALLRSQATSAAGDPNPGTKLRIERSSVAAFEATFQGENALATNGSGAPGAEIVDAFLYASQCNFFGGNLFGQATMGTGAPGTGLVASASSEVLAVASFFVAGGGGVNPVEGFVGPVQELSDDARTLVADAVSPAAGTTAITGRLVFFDRPTILATNTPALGTYVPLHLGVQLVAPPFAFFPQGFRGPSFYNVTVPAPSLRPQDPFQVTFYQGLFLDTDGEAFLSSASAVLTVP